MTVTKRTYYKALLLLIVFSLNAVVSFACSFSGLFHGFHHHKIAVASEHKHSVSHHSKSETPKHDHSSQPEHKHNNNSSKDSKDDCCSKSVIEIEKVEKALSRTIEAPQAIFLTSLFAAYTETFSLQNVEKIFLPKHVRWRLTATIQDLRIVIQSFQI